MSTKNQSDEEIAREAAGQAYDSFIKLKWSRAGWIDKVSPHFLIAIRKAKSLSEPKESEEEKQNL